MRIFTLITVGLLLTLTACATPGGASASLDGTSWDVTAINGVAPVAGAPTMAFTGDTMSGTTGCNSFSAGYTLNGSSITFGPGAQTAMACTDDLMKQEDAFNSALAKVAKLTVDGTTMQLQDASGQSLFTLAKAVPETPRPLQGTTWQLDTIRTGETASSVVADSPVTMQISSGTLSGKACNTFRADVTIDGDSVTVGPIASTRMACLNEDLTKQETTVLAILGKVTSMKITGARLQLSTGDGDGLDFTAQ